MKASPLPLSNDARDTPLPLITAAGQATGILSMATPASQPSMMPSGTTTAAIGKIHAAPARVSPTPQAMVREQAPATAIEFLRHAIARLAARRGAGDLDDAQFAALYFVHWQIARHGRSAASRVRKNDARADIERWRTVAETTTGPALHAWLLDCLERYQFRGVSASVPVALARWLAARWALELRDEVLSPMEILRAQARGRRVVTAVTAYPRLLEPILAKPNAFAFFLHDLEHAYKFFHCASLHKAQCEFFGALEAAIDDNLFAPYTADPVFVPKFHYLMSDMNSHPQHGREYLRAILIEHYLRRAGLSPAAELDAGARFAIERVLNAVAIPMTIAADV